MTAFIIAVGLIALILLVARKLRKAADEPMPMDPPEMDGPPDPWRD